MRLLIIFILWASVASAQILPFPGGAKGYAAVSSLSVEPVYSYSLNNTDITVTWPDVADTYEYQYASDIGFTTSLTTGTTSSNSLAIGSLSAGNTRYIRVRALETGYSPGEWSLTQCSTISFSPAFWYEIDGILTENDNSYGETTAAQVDKIKSIVNTSGPDADFSGTKASMAWNRQYAKYQLENRLFTLSSAQVITDYTLCARAIPITTFSTSRNIIYNAAGLTGVLWSSNTVNINYGGGPNLFPHTLRVERQYDMVYDRSGTTSRASMWGGGLFRSGTVGGSTTVSIDRLFDSNLVAGYQRVVLYNGGRLTQSQIDEVFNFEKFTNLTNIRETASPFYTSLSGINFNRSFTGNYFSDNLTNAITSPQRTRIWSVGDYTYVLLNKKYISPSFGEDYFVVERHSDLALSEIKEMGVLANFTEVHNIGSAFFYKGLLVHVEILHYSGGDRDDVGMAVKIFGKNNMTNYLRVPVDKFVTARPMLATQYYQGAQVGNEAVIIGAQWQAIGSQRYLVIMKSTNLANWSFATLADAGSSTDNWFYHHWVYSEDGTYRLFIQHVDASGSPSRHKAIFYIESSDGVIWRNKDNTWSKSIADNNPITLSELQTNAMFYDASGLTRDAKVTWALFDPSNSEVYGTFSNGSENGFKFFKIVGGTVTTADVDFTGHTMVYDIKRLIYDGENSPVVYKTDTDEYSWVGHEDNSTDWNIVRFNTTNSGTTWTYDTKLSTDDAHRHNWMAIPRNWHYATHHSIWTNVYPFPDNPDADVQDLWRIYLD